MPFLENVLRGKRVPRERMLEVAEHYKSFGGVSPINGQNRDLIESLTERFKQDGIELPIYWGNRNWAPLLGETMQQLADDGKRHVLAFFTSMYSSYSGCRQYRENIQAAQAQVGPPAPQVDKLRFGFNHPGFVGPMAENVRASLQNLDADPTTPVLFTAHSIPLSMADHCSYQKQLEETCRLVAQAVGLTNWQLVYQSRSGPPQQPWLEPDVCDTIAAMDDAQKLESLVIAPIGFISDHMEVIYDLDDEAAALCRQRSIRMDRSQTVGTHEDFVAMIAELVRERTIEGVPRRALGDLGPWHDVCPVDCCLYKPTRP